MAIGWAGTRTQRGMIITGSRSTSERINSKERLPEPRTIEARNSMTGTPLARRMSPTSCRLRKCGDRDSCSSPKPPR